MSNIQDFSALTDHELAQVKRLGVTSLESLLAMLLAAPNAGENMFGAERARALVVALKEKLGPEIANSLLPVRSGKIGGAMLDTPAPLPSRSAELLQQRDRMFEELNALKRIHADRDRIAALESQLTRLLESI